MLEFILEFLLDLITEIPEIVIDSMISSEKPKHVKIGLVLFFVLIAAVLIFIALY